VTSDPTTLTLTWTPRAADLADASLARSREVGGAGARILVAVALALIAAVLLFATPATASLGFVLIGVAGALVFLRVTAPLVRRRWSAILVANPTLAETCVVTFDEGGVHVASDRATSSRSWSAFASWSDTRGAVVLASSENALAQMVVIPLRALSGGEEAGALRRLVEHHLGPALGTGPGRASRTRLTWVARVVVVACLLVPLGVAMARVHDEAGEWRPWPSEAPPRVVHDGVTYLREGGPTGRPVQAAGIDYTSGGGLVLVPWPPTSDAPAAELWVLDHRGVVRHYVAP
jgi:hypothetical protein